MVWSLWSSLEEFQSKCHKRMQGIWQASPSLHTVDRMGPEEDGEVWISFWQPKIRTWRGNLFKPQSLNLSAFHIMWTPLNSISTMQRDSPVSCSFSSHHSGHPCVISSQICTHVQLHTGGTASDFRPKNASTEGTSDESFGFNLFSLNYLLCFFKEARKDIRLHGAGCSYIPT